MLIPQFSIRTLLALTVLAALVAWVLSQAAAGETWAQCTGYTLLFVVGLFLLYGVLFLAAWTTGLVLGIIAPVRTPPTNPFASMDGNSPVTVNPFAAVPVESQPPTTTT